MALQFSKDYKSNKNEVSKDIKDEISRRAEWFKEVNYIGTGDIGIPFKPLGCPKTIPKVTKYTLFKKPRPVAPPAMPGSDLPRALSFLADHGGCGLWRLGFPLFLLNYKDKAIIDDLTSMVLDPYFYKGYKAIVLQRQATPLQLEFSKFLQTAKKYLDLKILYNIDDIVFREDIPEYNRCKFAFTDDSIYNSIMEIMQIVDEIVVTCKFMKEYYINKTGNKNVTVIPNYLPKMWWDGFYNETEILKNYELNKNKPKVLYSGGSTHYKAFGHKSVDDFSHVVKDIIAARKKYEWIFLGGFPSEVKPFIDNGEMKYYPWVSLLDLPKMMHSIGSNCTYAPLEDNNFNKAKSNIKLTEAGSMGLPCICQNLCTYEDALLKFNNGNDLIDKLDFLFKDEETYMKFSKQSREYCNTMWLDEEKNLMKHYESLFLPYGDSKIKYLKECN